VDRISPRGEVAPASNRLRVVDVATREERETVFAPLLRRFDVSVAFTAPVTARLGTARAGIEAPVSSQQVDTLAVTVPPLTVGDRTVRFHPITFERATRATTVPLIGC
jgi:hypothetical protein